MMGVTPHVKCQPPTHSDGWNTQQQTSCTRSASSAPKTNGRLHLTASLEHKKSRNLPGPKGSPTPLQGNTQDATWEARLTRGAPAMPRRCSDCSGSGAQPGNRRAGLWSTRLLQHKGSTSKHSPQAPFGPCRSPKHARYSKSLKWALATLDQAPLDTSANQQM